MNWRKKSKKDWGRLDLNYKETPFGKIPEHWGVGTILENSKLVTDYVANGSFASLKENVQYKNEPDYAILIRLVDFNNEFDGNFVYLSRHSYDFLKKSKLFGNEIIISNVGANVGTVFKAPSLSKPMSLGPNSIMFIPKGDNDFYYYWMKSRFGQHMLKSIVSGSAQPKFNKTDFRRLEIPVPPINEQKEIGSILRSLDDRIAENKKINHHLAEIAKSIFDSYFIDLEPYGGNVPVDWQSSNLTGIANYLNGLAMQKYRPQSNEQGLPVLKIKELRQGFTDSTSDLCSSSIRKDYIIHDGDVIFSWSGSLLVDFWTGGGCGLNQHLFKVTSGTYDKWFYYAWTKHHLDRFIKMAADRATTMGHIKRDALEKAEVLIPSDKDYDEIGNMLKPIYDQIINNRIESRKLVALRDSLLPKLMSGEISVN